MIITFIDMHVGTIIVQPEAVPDNDSDFEGPEFKTKVRSRRSVQKGNCITFNQFTSGILYFFWNF